MARAGRAVTRPASLLGRAIVLFALARAAPAAAHPPSPSPMERIDLTIDDCVGQGERAVRSVVAMEVGTRPELAGTRGPVARVRIDCDGAATRIEIADPITGKTVTRRIQVGEVSPAIRARVLGLAVAELLVASWVELQLPGESAAVSVDAVAPAADRAAVMSLVRGLERARPSPRRLTVTGFAAARFFTAGTQLSLVGMDVELRVSPHLALACDVTGERGDADNQLGRIETSVLSMPPASTTSPRSIDSSWPWAPAYAAAWPACQDCPRTRRRAATPSRARGPAPSRRCARVPWPPTAGDSPSASRPASPPSAWPAPSRAATIHRSTACGCPHGQAAPSACDPINSNLDGPVAASPAPPRFDVMSRCRACSALHGERPPGSIGTEAAFAGKWVNLLPMAAAHGLHMPPQPRRGGPALAATTRSIHGPPRKRREDAHRRR
jgi:hypothetical protein